MRRFRAALLMLALWAAPAAAEDIVGVLSTQHIAIDSSFGGDTVVLFGAVERDAATVARPQGYDIVVVVRGPGQQVTTRRKERVLGLWVNRDSQSYVEVPSYYAVLSTAPLDRIATEDTRRRMQLGIDAIVLPAPSDDIEESAARDAQFSSAFRRLKRDAALYVENAEAVKLLAAGLFRADIPIPANVPTGTLKADIHLFADGVLLKTRSLSLTVAKTGLERLVFEASFRTPLLYGLGVATLSFLTGWLASVMFRRE